MLTLLMILFAACAGMAFSVQGPINAGLTQYTGSPFGVLPMP